MVIVVILTVIVIFLGLYVIMEKSKSKSALKPNSVEKVFLNNQPEIITGHEYIGPPIRRSFMDSIRSRLYPQGGVDVHLDLGLHDTLAQDPDSIPNRRKIIPINIETRGAIPNYDQVGFIYNEETQDRLPLFGRPKYIGSSQWEYYSNDNSRNRIPLPIDNKNKELDDESNIVIKGVEGEWKTLLYQREKSRYIPYI